MKEYIEREATIDYLTLNMNWTDEDGQRVDDWDERRKIFADFIDGIHSVDIEVPEQKHGKWERKTFDYIFWANYCYECNAYLPYGVDWEPNFCPNCGARMDGET